MSLTSVNSLPSLQYVPSKERLSDKRIHCNHNQPEVSEFPVAPWRLENRLICQKTYSTNLRKTFEQGTVFPVNLLGVVTVDRFKAFSTDYLTLATRERPAEKKQDSNTAVKKN